MKKFTFAISSHDEFLVSHVTFDLCLIVSGQVEDLVLQSCRNWSCTCATMASSKPWPI